MDGATDGRTPSGAAQPWDHHDGSDDQPATPRYRHGRGGFDPEAAALAARARYTFRQRMVLGLVLLAVASALVAGGLRLTEGWLVHAGVDVFLVGYLVYLRRQVRMEQAIRARRAARLAGSRAPAGARGSEGARARRGRPGKRGMTVADAVAARDAARRNQTDHELDDHELDNHELDDHELVDYDEDDYGFDEPSAPSDDADLADDDLTGNRPAGGSDDKPALPRLRPMPPPERPDGTVVLELDDEDPELHDLDHERYRAYRRAAGQ